MCPVVLHPLADKSRVPLPSGLPRGSVHGNQVQEVCGREGSQVKALVPLSHQGSLL